MSRHTGSFPALFQAAANSRTARSPSRFSLRPNVCIAGHLANAWASARAPEAPTSFLPSSSSFNRLQEGKTSANCWASKSPQPRPAKLSLSAPPRARANVSRYLSATAARSAGTWNFFDSRICAKRSGGSGGAHVAWHSCSTWLQSVQPGLSRPMSITDSGLDTKVATARSNAGQPRAACGVAPGGTSVISQTSVSWWANHKSAYSWLR
mmetsp:Transcript_58491/g.178372  ORF Transcript_58491/g.178372 Transcript_58491/m.178372 type:complete len:209 (+) Transcript_58491:134-760(+)